MEDFNLVVKDSIQAITDAGHADVQARVDAQQELTRYRKLSEQEKCQEQTTRLQSLVGKTIASATVVAVADQEELHELEITFTDGTSTTVSSTGAYGEYAFLIDAP